MDVNSKAPVIASAEITIDAPAAHVWQILTDLEQWPRWNPDVRKVEILGPLAVGAEFRWKVGGSQVQSTLLQLQRQHRLAWTDRMMGLTAMHVWELETDATGTRVRTRESFEGILARLLRRTLSALLSRSLNQSLARLKNMCEQPHRGAEIAF